MTAHDSWAKVYDRAYTTLPFGTFYNKLTECTLKVIKEEFSKGLKVIDFGAGTGRLACPLSELGYEVTAVDPSVEMLKELQSKDIKQKINTQNEFMQNFTTNERFDFGLCVFSVLIYLTDDEKLNQAFSALRDCLKPNGLVLIDIPLPQAFRNLSYQSSNLRRNVIIHKESDVFNYSESIDVLNGDKWINYSDEFKIRCWQPEIVLSKMKKHGFIIQKDLTERFAGSGALYFLFKLELN